MQLRCSNCTTWSKGTLNVQSTSANLIYAYGDTAPSNPSSSLSSFTQHTDHGNFQLNLKVAQTTSNSAPLLSGQSTQGGHSGSLSERQWVLKPLNSLIVDHSSSWNINGIDLGSFIPSRRDHYQIFRQNSIKCSRNTSNHSNRNPSPSPCSRRSRSLPRQRSSIYHLPYYPPHTI